MAISPNIIKQLVFLNADGVRYEVDFYNSHWKLNGKSSFVLSTALLPFTDRMPINYNMKF
jgi:hypothetical protein